MAGREKFLQVMAGREKLGLIAFYILYVVSTHIY
jgi:hypothetical protein